MVALVVAGCSAPFQASLGATPSADVTMAAWARQSFDCAQGSIEHQSLGNLPGTMWWRHEYRVCGHATRFWLECAQGSCWMPIIGLEPRAALDLNCPMSEISVEGIGPYMRAQGCESSAIYVLIRHQWIRNDSSADGARAAQIEVPHDD